MIEINIEQYSEERDFVFYVEGSLSSLQESFPEENITEKTIELCKQEVITSSFDEVVNSYTALHRGNPVGLITVSLLATYSKLSGYIENIYVENEFRGNGISQQLIAKARDWAIEHNAQSLLLDVTLSNKFAINCFEKYSFKTKRLQMELDIKT
jgi:ribosomal protein S18 acetylase RimI-like enzyme